MKTKRLLVFIICSFCILGGCGQTDTVKALLKKAEHGNAEAQYLYACNLYEKAFYKSDYKLSFLWFEKAAEQNHASAQNKLSFLYSTGTGIEKDLKKAFYWQTKSAENGLRLAQQQLGDDYYRGLKGVVKKDINKAIYWYQKAAEQGDDVSAAQLGHIYEGTAPGARDLSKRHKWKGQDYEKAIYWYEKSIKLGNVLHEKARKQIDELRELIKKDSLNR